MEMMVVASLQDLTTDIAVAVGAFYSELLLVILLAVRHAVPIGKKNVRANHTYLRFIPRRDKINTYSLKGNRF